MSKRRAHSPEFKARIAMEAISGRKTIQEIAANHAIHPIQVSQWKRQPSMFAAGAAQIHPLFQAHIDAGIDALYLKDPCSDSRRMVDYLARERIPISRERAQNLMRRMGLRTIYRKTHTTVPGDPCECFPYLVDLTQLTRVGQVWGTEITSVPLQKGFLYLLAIVDLFSRNVLSWKLSNSFNTDFCLEALEMAPGGGHSPEVFHANQGGLFTSANFVAHLKAKEIKNSWSGRKRSYANILVKRLWRTVKHEEGHLRAYRDGWEAEIVLARFVWRYCHVRPHSSLGGRTPHEAYTEIKPWSSLPELTTSGAGTAQ